MMKSKAIHLFLLIFLWNTLLTANLSAERLYGGFEKSEDYLDDLAIEQVRSVLGNQESWTGVRWPQDQASRIGDDFDFVRRSESQFYVFTGSDFVYVDIAGEPASHYVAHLFEVESGKINVFWSVVRKQYSTFFISYKGKRNDGTEGKHVFFLEIRSDGKAWCNDVFGLENLAQADPEKSEPVQDVLHNVWVGNVDHDDEGLVEMICFFESPVSTPWAKARNTMLFREEKIHGESKIALWKPTYSPEFFRVLFRK